MPLLFEHERNLVVAQWFFEGLRTDKLLDQRAHRRAGGAYAIMEQLLARDYRLAFAMRTGNRRRLVYRRSD